MSHSCVFGGVTLCDTVRVFGRVVPINAPAKPQHSLITAFTAALIHVDRPHCEQQKLCHRIVNNVLAHIAFSISKKKRGKTLSSLYLVLQLNLQAIL